ncbi:MAG: DUF2934 domain-containing protein [Steroidobacteraceae bacterium]
MTTSKRTTRGTSSIARPDNGATPPSAAPPSATPPKARARQRKSASSSSRTTASQTAPTEAARPALDRYASIAQAAYFRSQHRGFKPGHEMEDWLAAEAEVDQRLRGEGRTSGDSTD